MMTPTVIRLPDDDKNFIEEEARKQRQSTSEIVRQAITAYRKNKPHQESGVESLLGWIKENRKYKSQFKNKNLSTTYKKYLYSK